MHHVGGNPDTQYYDIQQTTIPKRTPMTKSQRVIQTIMLTMVMYSVLKPNKITEASPD